MDRLSALFFEDTEEDGIYHENDEMFESDVATEETDGATKLTLHQFIRRHNLQPPELKRELAKNQSESVVQVNQVDEISGLAPIHYIITHYAGHHATLLLLTLITYGNADINIKAANGKTALMLAVKAEKLDLVKDLVALGANVNLGLEDGVTPLKMAREISGDLEESTDCNDSGDWRGFESTVEPETLYNFRSPAPQSSTMVQALKSVGATAISYSVPQLQTPNQITNVNKVAEKYKKLNDKLKDKREEHQSNPSPQIAKEVLDALEQVERYRKENGSRILCLDGGGVKGLVQIEMLRQIELRTGKEIIKLFDWIVGSSTGGIIALALVHGRMSVSELQRLYLRLKRNVFSRSGVFSKGNSYQLEWYLTREFTGTMDSEPYPRVLVSAVKQTDFGMKLVFFNNCFEDDFSKEEVWKVARYTSAAPLYFSSRDDYLDGGLLAGNPAPDAITAIQTFYRRRQMQLPISLVVSLGSGINCTTKRTPVDITTNIWNVPSRIFPFMNIIGEALMSPQADANCSSRCEEQGIKYVRLNPQLEEAVDSAETDNKKLMRMLWATRQYLHSARNDSGKTKLDILSDFFADTVKEC